MTMVPLGISSYSGARFVLRRVGEIGGLALVFGWKCSVLICETAVRPYIFFFFLAFFEIERERVFAVGGLGGPQFDSNVHVGKARQTISHVFQGCYGNCDS
jgi:hypothetical protein